LAKCSFTKKPYAPGQHSKKGGPVTDFGKQLLQKQTLKRSYGLREKQFKNYFKKAASSSKEDFLDLLVRSLETRLDNVVYRLGFADSRAQARQLVGHGFLQVNEGAVNIPSFALKQGDVVSFKINKESKKYLDFLRDKIEKKKKEVPSWLELDAKELKGRLVALPNAKEVKMSADLQSVIEFYSR